MKFTIDRKFWDRGRGISSLLRTFLDGERKQCCVGHYLSAVGLKDDQLLGRSAADDVNFIYGLPPECNWLLSKGWTLRTLEAQWLYWINDCPVQLRAGGTCGTAKDYKGDDLVIDSEETREREIAAIFLRNGIEVTFTG